ncbi:B-block binding subunit of TFIIIC [Phytophthora cactorum]|nr:B-block binding subunit of TFIIIC [Phytophthora cactorum]
MAVKCSMPQFVARCLEEIGLEGRCGMPLRDLFEAMDPENDMAYRRYAWHVLRGMENQLSFHVMRPLEASATGSAEKKPKLEDCATPRRKRKWKTTLLNSPSVDTPAVKTRADDDAERTPKRHKSKNQPLQPVLPSMRRIAAQKQRRRLSESDCEGRDRSDSTSRLRRRRQRSGDGEVMVVEDGENDTVANDETMKKDSDKQGKERVPAQQQENEAGVSIKEEVEDAADETQWVLRSPRGYRLGEEMDVGGLSYEEAVTSNQDDVLGVVACEQLRLKYLGVEDATLMDTISPQFDLLEIIGRSRVRGENAAALTNSRLFGDSRKLHYLLDMLIGCNYVVKNIVTADQRRFNIVHLRRFASKFHPSMISQSATISRQAFPKEALAQVIVGMMKARGERTCVFADIGRELGYGKRHQEQLRNYFIQQMSAQPSFPLQLFMARCKTAGEYIGRKLWCIRLRDSLSCASSVSVSGRRRGSSLTFEDLGPGAVGVGRPVVERGIMEQMYVAIQDREDVGATVPELRDVLGVPTFKLPYKLAQGLISNYNISVEQVVLGKSTMYRMFVPGAEKRDESSQHATTGNSSNSTDSNVGVRVTRATDKYSTPKGADCNDDSSGQPQPGTMMQAARGVVRASTIDRRRNYILKRVQMEKIVSLHQLRTGLIDMERMAEASTMDIRSVRRIVDELVEEKKMTTMDITLPPKQVLQKAHRKVKCAVLLGYQRSRESIREFIKSYEEEQQRKYQANLVDHDNDDYVVVTNRRKQRRTGGGVVKEDHTLEAHTQEVRDQEVVKYSAVSYKLARLGLAKLQKQSRRLGMFFGMMFKCRAFHFMLWDRIELLSAHSAVDELRDAMNSGSSSDGLKEISFALKDVLDLLTVKEYIQLVGVPELLSDREESAVRLTMSKGGSWDALPESLVEKLEDAKQIAKAAAGPIQVLKRKHYQSDVPATEESSQKRRKIARTSNGSISALMTPVDTSEAGVSKFRKQVGAKKSRRTLTWALEDDLRLIDLYLEQMSCRWFVEVPLALQKKEERVAFRTTNLSRTLISWKELGKVFKKKPVECMLRVNDLLEAPAIQARLERAKVTMTQMKNPGGAFHEEVAIMSQPRLTALLCRALQVILHERSSYYSVLADVLMSNWKENFLRAAKYSSFVNENVDEATMVAEENDRYFEHEAEVNMPSGQAASVFGVSDVATQTLNIKAMEAFSGSAQVRQTHRDTRAKRKKHISHNSLASWLSVALTEAASSGVTLNELGEKYAASGLTKTTECNSVIQRELDEMVRKGRVLEVNGYDHSRFILQEFADLWALHPYRITSDSTAEKVHFLFDKDSTVVARPWLHLDGSVNTKMALKLKRKVVNIVMCCPGIKDSAVHKKMRKIVCLQDMRSLLEELLSNGPSKSKADIMSLSPGELRYVDFSRERMHYFPSVNCMELLGAEACDADLG